MGGIFRSCTWVSVCDGDLLGHIVLVLSLQSYGYVLSDHSHSSIQYMYCYVYVLLLKLYLSVVISWLNTETNIL